MSLSILAQVLVAGVLTGALYALVAFGLSLIYGVVRILNFSHGTVLAAAAILATLLFAGWHWPPVLLFLVLVPAFGLFGYGFYRVLLHPLRKKKPLESVVGTVLVTVGALLIISDLLATFAGTSSFKIALPVSILQMGGVVVTVTQIEVLLGIVALTVAMHWILKRTWFGRAVRAITQDHVGAALCGIRPQRIHAYTFALGYAIVAIGGILYAMSYPIDPYSGFPLTVKAFTIIVLGGIGSLYGALAAGIFLGVAEGLTAFFWASQWAPAVSIILLLAMLVLFPQGFGSRRGAA